jgi:hypothetical protein
MGPVRGHLQTHHMAKYMRTVEKLMANNAFELTVGHRGPRLAAARASGPAAQFGR